MQLGRLLPGVGPEHLGVRIGTSSVAGISGVTALIPPPGTTVGVDSRGGGPATHETDIARPGTLPYGADGIVLTGGSALGLASARGVQDRLAEAGVGTPVAGVRIPIVPAAAIFDVGRGGAPAPPDVSDGFRAADAAFAQPERTSASLSSDRGSVGAGIGAWTGRGFSRGGMGCASVRLPEGPWVSAVVIANSMGAPLSADGQLHAASALSAYGLEVPSADPRAVASLKRRAEDIAARAQEASRNTTIAVISTDAGLTDAETTRLAGSAHAGIARAVWPSHTMFDGDTVFALATGEQTQNAPELLTSLNIAAADALTAAIVDAVLSAAGQPAERADDEALPRALAQAVPELSQAWQRVAELRLGSL